MRLASKTFVTVCNSQKGVKTMLVYELDCARNCWQLVSETKVSFYECIEVTYFDSDLAPRPATSM